MVKVLYDNQIFNAQKFGGISRYFAEVISGIRRVEGIESFPKSFFSENKYLRQNDLTYQYGFTEFLHHRIKNRIHNNFKKRDTDSIISNLKNGNFDVFHPTYYDTYFLNYLAPHKPYVLTVYDMIHEIYYDDLFELRSNETRNKRILIPKASHIIAISQKTKDDILTFFPEVDEKKISVIHLGSSLSDTAGTSNIQLPLKYMLYVGNRGRYKNWLWFIRAIASFLIEQDLTLVCAGGGGFTEYETDQLNNSNLIDKVKYVDIVNDDELKVIYQKAIAMVFPSLHEGFGIPILEAFSCACPVVLINTACFREVGGNAALYFEKDHAEDLIRHLTSLLVDPKLSENLKDAGLKRLELFNWQRTVKQHIEVYKLFESSPER